MARLLLRESRTFARGLWLVSATCCGHKDPRADGWSLQSSNAESGRNLTDRSPHFLAADRCGLLTSAGDAHGRLVAGMNWPARGHRRRAADLGLFGKSWRHRRSQPEVRALRGAVGSSSWRGRYAVARLSASGRPVRPLDRPHHCERRPTMASSLRSRRGRLSARGCGRHAWVRRISTGHSQSSSSGTSVDASMGRRQLRSARV